MILFKKYSADWTLKRCWAFERSIETGKRIWPGQKAYCGIGNIKFPIGIYWLTPDEYLVLKLRNDI